MYWSYIYVNGYKIFHIFCFIYFSRDNFSSKLDIVFQENKISGERMGSLILIKGLFYVPKPFLMDSNYSHPPKLGNNVY